MKSLTKYLTVFITLLLISQLFAQRTNSGQIAVRLSSTNKMSTSTPSNSNIKVNMNSDNACSDIKLLNNMSISNNTLAGWELIARSENNGKLNNGISELTYSINVGNEKTELNKPAKILSTKDLGKINTTKFDLKMDINTDEASQNKQLLSGTFKDTISLTLYSND